MNTTPEGQPDDRWSNRPNRVKCAALLYDGRRVGRSEGKAFAYGRGDTLSSVVLADR